MTDTELIDWLEKNADGSALVSDDCGRWVVTCNGFQNVAGENPTDITTTFFIEKNQWQPSIREAIKAYIDGE